MREKNYSAILKIVLLLAIVFLRLPASGQLIQLFFEDFNGPTSYVDSGLNVAGGPGGVNGPNRWIINNSYDGLGVYPNTPREDSTYGGTIYGAPYSKYLHVYDSAYGASQGVTNCSYDATVASSNLATFDTICTLGVTDVHIAFFYTCMGSPGAYGELYYKADGGPWTQTGLPKYDNKTKWKYEDFHDAGFDNKAKLVFGFRWVNNSSAPPSTTAFGIDDIEIVGMKDTTLTLTITSVPDTVCLGEAFFIGWQLSAPVCYSRIVIERSTDTGDFSTPTALPFNYFIPPNQTTGFFYIPASVSTGMFPGNCYKFRLFRLEPLPTFYSTESPCIVLRFCPNTITTCPNGPPVVTIDPNDSNVVCAGSVIDVPFYSTGIFQANSYQLQLSDSSGSFANPVTLGSISDDCTYDPMNFNPFCSPPPGSVGGRIPDTTLAGCNYFIRVIGTGPVPGPGPTLGSVWGPFCIKHCDIITNNEQDITFPCLWPPDTVICINVPINVNFYDSTAVYQPGNQFQVQLISRGPFPPPFTLVGTPTWYLGSITAIGDTILKICLGPLDSMLAHGILPGSYYMRIVATNSSVPGNSSGSIVRFTIGAPYNDVHTLVAVNTLTNQPVPPACLGDQLTISVNPPMQYPSTVKWYINSNTPLQDPPWNQNVLYLNLNSAGGFTIRVRENSFGCLGVFCTPLVINVLGPPNVNIGGSINTCVGKTEHYVCPFNANNYYRWVLDAGAAFVDTSNNTSDIVFSTPGIHTISVIVRNACFIDTGYKTITVRPYPVADAGTDTSICTGSQITLINSPTDTAWTYRWTLLNNTVLGTSSSLTVSPLSTTQYVIQVTNFTCSLKDTITVTVDQPPQTSFTDSICVDGSSLVLDPGINPATYNWYDNSTTQQHTVTDTGTYTVNIQVPGEVCYRMYSYTVGSAFPDSSDLNSVICAGDPFVLDATEPGATYQWSTNETTPQITITSIGTYSVIITSPARRCSITKTYVVTDDPELCPRDFKLPNVFTPGNGDNYNNTFHAVTYGNYHQFNIKIFNRWGELVFESSDQYFQWDGTNLNGKECTAGVYYYVGNIVHPQDTRALQGFVTLLRGK